MLLMSWLTAAATARFHFEDPRAYDVATAQHAPHTAVCLPPHKLQHPYRGNTPCPRGLVETNMTKSASISGYTQSMPARLADAMHVATEYILGDSHLELRCDKEQQLGGRPCQHVNSAMGGPCEPWINRNTLTVLHGMLTRRMRVLSWSSGSSSTYLLRHVESLHDVEHDAAWLNTVKDHISTALSWRADDYHPAAVPSLNNYVRFPEQHLPHRDWDLVVIDGPAQTRAKCFASAMRIAKKQYGLLLLDNAERRVHDAILRTIPSHWLVVSFAVQNVYSPYSPANFLAQTGSMVETMLVMICPVGDHHCAHAKAEIHADYRRLTKHGVIGKRYYDHVGAC